MQTKQKIERLLGSSGVRPNTRLGQHFLIDLNLMRLLIDSARIQENDVVLEVGCGTGSLTEGLAEAASRVISVEYDEVLAGIAKGELSEHKHVTIIQGDILESKSVLNHEAAEAVRAAREQLGGRLLLVSNLPYSVSSPVMINLVTGPLRIDAMYVTVQKEVGHRMAASAGGRDYGPLSILLAATGELKAFHKLPPSVFWPQPAVDSVMVSYVRSEKKTGQIHDLGMLREVVSLFMGHRRKMLKACVKFTQNRLEEIHHWPQIFDEAFVDPHCRAEEIEPGAYISIANILTETLNK